MPLKYPYLGAFESTKIHGSGKDVLETTRHYTRWEHDLDMLLSSGIRELRYSVPWHCIEQRPGVFDWSWLDGPMKFLEVNGMDPVLDPLHHTSFPDWLDQGFANPQFPERYANFLLELRRRYSWANRYTLFNEPLPTTLFCSHTGMW
ncbi:MAG: beta-galactosidase, partial [Acidobacteriaceae bacterium]|nr:beta-galactosidase [Acidobacteriaceae bacterium]